MKKIISLLFIISTTQFLNGMEQITEFQVLLTEQEKNMKLEFDESLKKFEAIQWQEKITELVLKWNSIDKGLQEKMKELFETVAHIQENHINTHTQKIENLENQCNSSLPVIAQHTTQLNAVNERCATLASTINTNNQQASTKLTDMINKQKEAHETLQIFQQEQASQKNMFLSKIVALETALKTMSQKNSSLELTNTTLLNKIGALELKFANLKKSFGNHNFYPAEHRGCGGGCDGNDHSWGKLKSFQENCFNSI